MSFANLNLIPRITLMCVMVSACASSVPMINDKLDEATGVTITFIGTPLLLYRETPAQAAYARDYAQLGPIQVNRSGSYQYYLWIGSWATMQTSSVSEHRDGFESIVVFADGEPLALELSGWTPDAIGASEPTYLKPVASSTDAYYQVTIDQIRMIGEATDIRLRTGGSSPREYEPWDDQTAARAAFARFLEIALF